MENSAQSPHQASIDAQNEFPLDPTPEEIQAEKEKAQNQQSAQQPPHQQQKAAQGAPVTQTPPPAQNKTVAKPTGTNLIGQLLQKKEAALTNFLGDKENAMRFLSSVMHSVEKIPALLNCDTNSVLSAFMECAALGLYPGNASGDCYVLPYNGKAQFQIGYKGIKTLAYRSGVLRLWAEVIYEKDFFKEELGSNPKLLHTPPKFGEERGEPIGAYACAEVNPGVVIFKSMTKKQIMEIKAKSPAATSKYSPWNSGVDVDHWMWKKCAIKQLSKMMPQSDKLGKLQRAVYLDNIAEQGGYINTNGEIIEPSFGSEEAEVDVIENGKAKKAELRKKKK